MSKTPLPSFSEFTEKADADALYEMSNLIPKRTGLPFTIWVSHGGVGHDIRIKVADSPKLKPSEMASVSIRPKLVVREGHVSPADLKLLKKWVDLNYDIIVAFWYKKIEDGGELYSAVKPVK